MSHKTTTFVPFHDTCLVRPITSLTQTTRVCFTAHVWQLIVRDLRKHVNVITINAYSWMEAFQETSWDGQQNAVMHRMFSVNIELYPIRSQKSDNLINPYYQRASGSSQVDFCLTTKRYNINTKHESNELKKAKHFTAFLQGGWISTEDSNVGVLSSSGSILHNCRGCLFCRGFLRDVEVMTYK